MQEQIISFETAKLAKEKGFNWKSQHAFTCRGNGNFIAAIENLSVINSDATYNKEYDFDTISRPTQSLLQKWLRDVHNIEVIVKSWIEGKEKCYLYSVQELGKPSSYMNKNNFVTYEEALEEGLQEALKLI